jgi:hypothetical protein
VAGSAVMLVAVLLQIGRFQPENIQAYTAVIGAYSCSRVDRALPLPPDPGLDETALYEALGAVSSCSAIQSMTAAGATRSSY